MDKRTIAEITACFNGFPQSRATDPELFVMTVARAVEGIEQEAIIRACQAFCDGVVEGQSLDYAPAVPRFVKECRNQQAALQHARRPLPAPDPIPDTVSPPVDPAKFQAWSDAIAGRRSWESFADEYGIKAAGE